MNTNNLILLGTAALFLLTLGILLYFATPPPGDKRVTGSAIVTIENSKFKPNQLTVAPGTTVTWINNGPDKHNIVIGETASPFLKKDEHWSFTFIKAGSYNFYCSEHPFLVGVVEVK